MLRGRKDHPNVKVKGSFPILPVPVPRVPVETKEKEPLWPFVQVNVPSPLRPVT